jgi:hypothetical protein
MHATCRDKRASDKAVNGCAITPHCQKEPLQHEATTSTSTSTIATPPPPLPRNFTRESCLGVCGGLQERTSASPSLGSQFCLFLCSDLLRAIGARIPASCGCRSDVSRLNIASIFHATTHRPIDCALGAADGLVLLVLLLQSRRPMVVVPAHPTTKQRALWPRSANSMQGHNSVQ